MPYGDNTEVNFRFPDSAKTLPAHASDGDIDLLKKYLNCDDEQFYLTLTFIICCYLSRPYPILILNGTQDCGKSTFTRVLANLIDPSTSALRSKPRNIDDVWIAARNAKLLSYDNMSGIQSDLSDSFCQLATGSSHTKRQNYTDGDEFVIEAARPIILNGIDELTDRGDLADRSILLRLSPINSKNRISEDQFWADFEEDKPSIFSAICNIVQYILKNEINITPQELPRIANIGKAATALEQYLELNEGEILNAYFAMHKSIAVESVENSPLVRALVEVANEKPFEDSATRLFNLIEASASDIDKKSGDWPKNAQSLSSKLNRLEPVFKKIGLVCHKKSDSSSS